MKPHNHLCQCCNGDYQCEEKSSPSRCSVSKAAKANGAGPYCMRCYHGLMFFRLCPSSLFLEWLKLAMIHEGKVLAKPTVETVITGSQNRKEK